LLNASILVRLLIALGLFALGLFATRCLFGFLALNREPISPALSRLWGFDVAYRIFYNPAFFVVFVSIVISIVIDFDDVFADDGLATGKNRAYNPSSNRTE
jgi:hypothetical protein